MYILGNHRHLWLPYLILIFCHNTEIIHRSQGERSPHYSHKHEHIINNLLKENNNEVNVNMPPSDGYQSSDNQEHNTGAAISNINLKSSAISYWDNSLISSKNLGILKKKLKEMGVYVLDNGWQLFNQVFNLVKNVNDFYDDLSEFSKNDSWAIPSSTGGIIGLAIHGVKYVFNTYCKAKNKAKAN